MHEVMGANLTQADFLYGIEKPYLEMNIIYIGKFFYSYMINLIKQTQKFIVATDKIL